MGRLIDADKLKAHYAWWEGGTRETTMDEAKRDFDTIIDVQPTVDAEPVRHGHWLSVKGWDDELGELDSAECSVCHDKQDSEYWVKTYYHYCPNCGAKMDEVKDAE